MSSHLAAVLLVVVMKMALLMAASEDAFLSFVREVCNRGLLEIEELVVPVGASTWVWRPWPTNGGFDVVCHLQFANQFNRNPKMST